MVSLYFELPPLEPGNHWHRIIDTALPTPDDFCDLETAVKIVDRSYLVSARSSVILMEKIPSKKFKTHNSWSGIR